MKLNTILLISIAFLAIAAASMQARCHFRPHVSFGMNFGRPVVSAPVVYAQPYVAPSCHNCCHACAPVVYQAPMVHYAPRPQVGFSFGGRHAGFGFSF